MNPQVSDTGQRNNQNFQNSLGFGGTASEIRDSPRVWGATIRPRNSQREQETNNKKRYF